MCITLCLLLTACNNTTDSSIQINSSKNDVSSETDNSSKIVDSSSQIEEENDLFGIAFLGYTAITDERTLSSNYLTEDKIEKLETVIHEGDEVYLILPTSEDVKVEIYAFDELDEIGGIGDILYTSDKGNPILLQCNVSDILANVIIRFERGEEVVGYSPRVSLKDGKIILVEGAYELEKFPVNALDDKYYKILRDYLGDKAKGKSLMRVDDEIIDGKTCAVIKMGTSTKTHFATENWYAVSDDGSIYQNDISMDKWEICK